MIRAIISIFQWNLACDMVEMYGFFPVYVIQETGHS